MSIKRHNLASNARQSPKHNIVWIDNLKAVGIVLVIFGHTVPANTDYIYSFHVPLFFFASGFLAKDRFLQSEWTTFFGRNFRRLIVPYLTLGMATYLFWLLVLRRFGENLILNIPPLKPLYGMLTGLGTDRLLQHNPPLWFLPCLFLTVTLFSLFLRIANHSAVIIVLITVSAIIGFYLPTWLPIRLYGNLDIAFVAVTFYGVGYLLQRHFEKLATFNLSILQTGLLLIVLLVLQLYLYQHNGKVDMFFTWYGQNIIYFYGAAFCGLGFWSILCAYMPQTRLMTLIAQESLPLFLLHKTAFHFITAFGIFVLGYTSSFKDEMVFAFIYTGISILMILPLAAVIKRHVPWILGHRMQPKLT